MLPKNIWNFKRLLLFPRHLFDFGIEHTPKKNLLFTLFSIIWKKEIKYKKREERNFPTFPRIKENKATTKPVACGLTQLCPQCLPFFESFVLGKSGSFSTLFSFDTVTCHTQKIHFLKKQGRKSIQNLFTFFWELKGAKSLLYFAWDCRWRGIVNALKHLSFHKTIRKRRICQKREIKEKVYKQKTERIWQNCTE